MHLCCTDLLDIPKTDLHLLAELGCTQNEVLAVSIPASIEYTHYPRTLIVFQSLYTKIIRESNDHKSFTVRLRYFV